MVYIIILNWNNPNDTISCLNSVINCNLYNQFKIVICDNGSKDNSIEQFSHWYFDMKERSDYLKHAEFQLIGINNIEDFKTNANTGVYLIDINENLGYAKGNNQGIKFALNQADMAYVWILNNDTEIEKNSLSEMIEKFERHNTLGICGSKLVDYYFREKIQSIGGKLNSWLCTVKNLGCDESSSQQYDDDQVAQELDYVVGASMLINRDFLNKVGLMSESFFLYFEELDLCIRAKKAGFSIYTATKSIVYHKEGGTTGKKLDLSIQADYSSVRNRIIFTYKHYPYKLPIVYISIFGVLFNRLKRNQYIKAKNVIKVLCLNIKSPRI